MRQKTDKMEVFKKDLQRGLVDDLVIDIIITLNNSNNLKTTSSCSGRIVALCFDELEKKYRSKKASFHFIPRLDYFINVLVRVFRQCKGIIIVRVRGFIVDMETSISDVINLLRKLSFKTAIIKPSKRYDRIVVELRSSIALDIPLLEPPNKKIYYISTVYLWKNIVELNVFRNTLWYTISEDLGDDEATLK